MIPTVAVGAFVFDAENRVLLVERSHPPGAGLWTVPGGKLEYNETLVQAVAREVREETGLVVEVGTLACVVERIADNYHYVILDYLARVIGGTLDPSGDCTNARWVPEADLFKLPLTDGLSPLIERARKGFAAWTSLR